MADKSKLDDPATTQKEAEEPTEDVNTSNVAKVESDHENEEEDTGAQGTTPSSSGTKKKSKKKRIKDALKGGGSSEASGSSSSSGPADISKAIHGLSKAQVQEILKMNPSLAQDLGVGSDNPATVAENFKKLSLEEILSGLASSGKNVKDMAGYKFWATQPVPKLGDKAKIEKEGPIKEANIDLVRKEPYPMAEGYEWVTMDLLNGDELKEVYELLNGHYVEDDQAMFRFNYSKSFLQWCASIVS